MITGTVHCDDDVDGRKEIQCRKFMLTSELCDGNSCMTKNGHFLAFERCFRWKLSFLRCLRRRIYRPFLHWPPFSLCLCISSGSSKAFCVDSKLDMCSTFRHLEAALATDKLSWALCLSFASKNFFIRKILEKFFTYTRHNIPMGNATEPAAQNDSSRGSRTEKTKNYFFRGAARCWQPFTLHRVDIMSIQMTRTLNESVFAL